MSKNLKGKLQDAAEVALSKAASTASEKLLTELVKQLLRINLPDTEGETPVMCSNVEFGTAKSGVSHVDNPRSVVTFKDSLIHWDLSNLGVVGSGNWNYHYLCGGETGKFDVSHTGIRGVVTIALEKKGGKVECKVRDSNIKFGNPDANFSGGALCSCCRMIFMGKVYDIITKDVQQKLENGVRRAVENSVPAVRCIEDVFPIIMGAASTGGSMLKAFKK